MDSRSDPNFHVNNLYPKNSPVLTAASSVEQRANLSLCLEGVAPHDAILLKSLIRLLNYRTNHNWTIDTGSADLHILGEEAPQTTDHQSPGNVLWVGHSAQTHTPFLHLPIRANELELQLNSLGSSILKNQAQAHSSPSAPLPHDEMLALHRWPPASVLGTPMHIKLATLMTRQPMSIEALARRSGATPHDCVLFCQALQRAGILKRDARHARPQPQPQVNDNPVKHPKPDASLLQRIRSRFGL